jgi:hypothetical protein
VTHFGIMRAWRPAAPRSPPPGPPQVAGTLTPIKIDSLTYQRRLSIKTDYLFKSRFNGKDCFPVIGLRVVKRIAVEPAYHLDVAIGEDINNAEFDLEHS